MKLDYATSTRYLGVIMDDRLTWAPHWNEKFPSNLKFLRQLASRTRQLHGSKPKLMQWIYTGIIRPKLTYGAMIWAHSTKSKTMIKHLYNLNRTACMMITATTRSTPQASLELIYNIPPLDLYLNEIGLTTYIRLKPQLEKPWASKLAFAIPHLLHWDNQMKTLFQNETDDRCCETSWEKNYHVILTSFNNNLQTIKPSEYNIYTDGSKTSNGVGAGFVMYHKKTRIHTESISLPDSTTVFQAEIIAIYKAMLFTIGYCRSNKVSYLKILCDSQAAIRALDSHNVRSLTVLKTIDAMNSVAELTISTRLEWVKAHIGIEGNEEADKAAKEGADTMDTTHHVNIPWVEKQAKIKEYTNKQWTTRWETLQGHRQTKLFLHNPDPNKANGILRLSRGYLTTFVRALTGHNFLGKHQNYIDNNISKVCRFCESDEETFHHFITHCPLLRQLQEDIFLDKLFPTDNSWSIHKVKQFMLEPQIYRALTSKLGLSQIELEPHEIGLPSDSDSSL